MKNIEKNAKNHIKLHFFLFKRKNYGKLSTLNKLKPYVVGALVNIMKKNNNFYFTWNSVPTLYN